MAMQKARTVKVLMVRERLTEGFYDTALDEASDA